MASTILITGVSGFLGRYAAREFLRRGWKVCGLDDVPAENAPAGVAYRRLRLPDPALASVTASSDPNDIKLAGEDCLAAVVEDLVAKKIIPTIKIKAGL